MALAFGLTLYRFLKHRAMVYEHLIALLFFAWASANHSRHTPFFSVAAAVCLTAMPLSAGARPVLRAALKLAVIAVFALFYRLFVWSQYAGPAQFNNCSEGLTAFLNGNAAALSRLKMYNYWGWDGYLGFSLSPEYKVFADGRYIFHEFLGEMENCRNDPAAWENFKGKYGFGLVVMSRDKNRIPVKQRFNGGRESVAWRPAYLFYLPRKDWAVVYWDMKTVVLAKRGAVDPAWLAGREYKHLRPDDMQNAAAAALEGDIKMAEIREEAQRFSALAAAGPAGVCSGAAPAAGAYMADWLKLLESVCVQKGAKCKP